MDERQISVELYHYLCENIVGSEEIVNIRRILLTTHDNIASRDDAVLITSGSFGEGLEMEGSDVDIMYVFKSISVCEDTSCLHHKPYH